MRLAIPEQALGEDQRPRRRELIRRGGRGLRGRRPGGGQGQAEQEAHQDQAEAEPERMDTGLNAIRR